jgi:catechol 2,3-dioxygenase
MNTWAGVGVPPPSSNTARLHWYQIHLPDKSALHQVIDRLGAADLSFEEQEAGFFLQDPSANGILLTTGQ